MVPRRPVLSPEHLAAWAAYEAAGKAAAEQYEALPIAHQRASEGSPCIRCHARAARAKDGVCPQCRREEAL